MKKILVRYALTAVLLAGCGKDADTSSSAPQPSSSPVVFGAANSVSAAAGRKSLIGNREEGKPMENGTTTLAEICTPTVGGEAIAVWGDYCRNGIPSDRAEYTTVFRDTRLVYDNNAGTNPHSAWNYRGSAQYWMNDCSYRFRAYFPATVEPISSSNVMTLSLEYQSNRAQDDLMVAYNEADTAAPSFDPTDPVELYFRHTLAALRFRFELGYGNSDTITACWLENGVRDDFAVAGILFCERRESGGRIFTVQNPPQENELDAYFRWMKGYCPEPIYDRFYKWSCTDGNGLQLETEVVNGTVNVIKSAVAYDCTKDATAEGELFTQNGGWLLILPQESSGNLQLCFQTEHGGNSTVFRVNIPKDTTTRLYENGVPKADEAGNPVYGWRAGKRYSYTVRIRKSDLQVSLAVADWNMRYSSTQIEF
ncbi:MAG: fimbrillin family protein [Alistipes sp.]|nr:fimbrillin family protein [Alistipes sp.]